MADRSLRLIICDDDPAVRAAVRVTAEDHGHAVIAETDQGPDAIDLVSRFRPDALILDLSLRFGAGSQVIDSIRDRAIECAVVVFSAFARDFAAHDPVVAVVEKPDFERLVAVLAAIPDSSAAHADDRRQWETRPPAPTRPSGAVSDPEPAFYEALAAARPGDALVVIKPPDPSSLHDLAAEVRRRLRTQDWMLIQPTRLVVLLIGGHPGATPAFKGRVAEVAASCEVADTVIAKGEAPGDALARVRHQLI